MKGYKKEQNGEIQEELDIKDQLDQDVEYASAGIVVRYNSDINLNELLLIQRARDDSWPLQWEIPRGKCDKEMNTPGMIERYGIPKLIIMGLNREIKEETGLDIIPVEFVDKFMYIFPDKKAIQYNFYCQMKDNDQEVKLSFEHEDYKWVTSMNEIKSLGVPKELLVVLSKVFNKDGEIIDYPVDVLSRAYNLR